MTHIPGRSTSNSLAATLDSDQPTSLAIPSLDTDSSSVHRSYLHPFTEGSYSRFFTALGDLLPQILAALQSHLTSSGLTTCSLA